MTKMKWFRATALVLLATGAFVAVIGGAAFGILRAVASDSQALRVATNVYESFMAGFVLFAILAAALTLIELAGRTAVQTAPTPEPAPEPAKKAEAAPVIPATDLPSTFRQMKTFIDLEMWELALEKANDILRRFPDSNEARIVSRHMNDLRWKAEPKFVTQPPGTMTADQEKALQSKGLAAMLQHVRTYMELEMWDLAKEKTLAVMKNFPNSKESNELAQLYTTIDKKCRQPALAQAPSAERAPAGKPGVVTIEESPASAQPAAGRPKE